MCHRFHEDILKRVAFEVHAPDFDIVRIGEFVDMPDVHVIRHDDLDALRLRVHCGIAAEAAGRVQKRRHIAGDFELQELSIRAAHFGKIRVADEFSRSEDDDFVAGLFDVRQQVR